MANHDQVVAQLLRNASKLFRDVAGQNPHIKEQKKPTPAPVIR
jgi:hypothetical protein